MDKEHKVNRRDFIKKSSVAFAGISVLSSNVIGINSIPPSDKLNIASIGVGGVGLRNTSHLKKENIVALCDVDLEYAEKAFRRWPDAHQYTDFRVMLEKEANNIDAVIVATPDHIHSIAAISAMQLGKHVFVQAPMAHSIYELSRMKDNATAYGVVTQVGNAVSSTDNVKKTCEILWSGAIGDVQKVDVWANPPLYRHQLFVSEKKPRVPKDLNWDLFLGPVNDIPYQKEYAPYGWRNWWAFGGGSIASIGADLLDPVFKGLKLQSPTEVQASTSDFSLNAVPESSRISFWYAQRDNLPRLSLPKLQLNWYDGGLQPSRPADMSEGMPMGSVHGGVLFYGSKATMLYTPFSDNPIVFKNGDVMNEKAPKKMRRVDNPLEGGHEADWVRAIKEAESNRLQTGNTFDDAYSLNETVLLAGLAVRLQSLNKRLKWDPTQMLFTNISGWEEVKILKEKNYRIENGLPKFENHYDQFNAMQYASQIIMPVFRDGWMQV